MLFIWCGSFGWSSGALSVDLIPEFLWSTTGMKFDPELALQQEVKFSLPFGFAAVATRDFLFFFVFSLIFSGEIKKPLKRSIW